MKRSFLVVCALLAGGLAGCDSMSKRECEQANWQSRGLEDGRAGRPASYISSHREACGKAGIEPDAPLWRAGWSKGIGSYCTPNSAWMTGVNKNVPGRLKRTFMAYAGGAPKYRQKCEEIAASRGGPGNLDSRLSGVSA